MQTFCFHAETIRKTTRVTLMSWVSASIVYVGCQINLRLSRLTFSLHILHCFIYCSLRYLDEDSAIRGCLSDLDSDSNTCSLAGEDCIKCNEEFCNLQSGNDYVTCVTCSSDDDESCGYRQETDALSKL